MGIIKKTFSLCKCERCNYEWIPNNINDLPEMCASCNSPYWNKPRKKKTPSKPKPIQPARPIRPIQERSGIFGTSASRDRPTRKPTQREIDKAGIGGAT